MVLVPGQGTPGWAKYNPAAVEPYELTIDSDFVECESDWRLPPSTPIPPQGG